MRELESRPYDPVDAAALTDLLNLLDEKAGGHPGLTDDQLAVHVTQYVRDVEANTRLVFALDGTLVAAALATPPPDGGFRVDLDGGVHPAWRGRGIGRELFAYQLARAAEIRAERQPSVDWTAHASAMVDDEDAQRLYRRFGLTPARYWFDMEAPTADPPVLALPDGLRAVGYAPEHEKALHGAHIEAFSDHWGHQPVDFDTWITATARSSGFRSELSVLAFDGDELAAYVLSYKDKDPNRLYIGHVGTRRPWRRRGLAGALLAKALSMASDAGLTHAALGVDADSPTGAVGVYERVGFAAVSRAVTYALPLTG